MGKRYAALPFRRTKKGVSEVLLITSRDSGRWIIPKGRPEKRMAAHRVAAREAREEAGVEGSIKKRSIGSFKDAGGKDRVVVYALEVKKELKRWLEQGERKQKWLSIVKATRKVDQKGLRAIMRHAAKAF